MDALLYYITLPFLYLISLLPFRILYLFSDLLCFVLFNIIGYRKKVILNNLRNSFPDKSADEIKIISNKFHHYFCDLVLETIKTLTITAASANRHFIFEDVSIVEKYKKENKSIIIVMGHLGNWELGGDCFSLKKLHQLYVVYQPLN